MEVYLSQQISSFAACIILGMGYGLCCDVLRALRPGKNGKIRWPGDILCCIIVFLSLFFFSAGHMAGTVRLYNFAAALMGAAGYFRLLSAPVAAVLRKIRCGLVSCATLLFFPVKFLYGRLKIIWKSIKYLFNFGAKWYTMSSKFSHSVIRRHQFQSDNTRVNIMKWKKSSFVLLFIVFAVIIYSAVNIISVRSRLHQALQERDVLTDEIEIQTQINSQLEEDTKSFGEESKIKEIARDKLGLVENGAVIFYDVGK